MSIERNLGKREGSNRPQDFEAARKLLEEDKWIKDDPVAKKVMEDEGMTEAAIMRAIQIEASKQGCRLFRNNCGQAITKSGNIIRFGLANPGGSDLIGWKPVTITKEWIGQRIAVFTAIEVKCPGKKPTQSQADFIEAVKKAGGIALVACSVEESLENIKGVKS